MTKYRKKPVVIEATQWFKLGDHPNVEKYDPWSGFVKCQHCGLKHGDHGWIKTLEGGHIVCPGDFIITGPMGEQYPCKPHIFEMTYEKVDEG